MSHRLLTASAGVLVVVASIWFFADVEAQSAGPVVEYAFSEGAGTTAADHSLNGNDGAIANGAAWGTGRFGGALALDGYDDVVGVGSADPLQLATAFTIEAWVRPTTYAWHTIAQRGSGAEFARLEITATGYPRIAGYFGGEFAIAETSSPITLNRWTHLAATYDGTALRIFVDGVARAVAPASGSLASSSEPLLIGGMASPGRTINGALDEVRVYRRALTASEVQLDLATPVDEATPFQVGHYTPELQQVGVLSTPVTVTFSRAITAATLSTTTFELVDESLALVPASVSYDAAGRRATLTPASPLDPATEYTVRVVGGSAGVLDAGSASLAADLTWTFRTASPVDAPSAAFAFSEGTGDVTADYSGNGNAGLLVGTPAWTAAGRSGAALTLDGVVAGYNEEQGVLVRMSETLSLTGAFTVEAWIKPTGAAAHILGQSGSYGLDIGEELGNLRFWGFFDGVFAIVEAPVPVALNAWTHVAVVYDEAASAPRLKLYVDGALVSTNADAAGPLTPSSTPLWLGGMPGSWRELPGTLDEVRIYRTALSAAQIVDDMAAPVDSAAPFQVSQVTPASGAMGVRSTAITATFSKDVDPVTLTTSTFSLVDAAAAPVPASVAYTPSTRTATLTPLSALSSLADYTARISGGAAGVKDDSGGVLAADVTWTFRTASANDQPAASFAFSEGAGTTTADQSGNGNVGTLVGASAWTTAGRSGNAVAFMGEERADRGVRVAPSETLAFGDAFTVEAWVKPTGDLGYVLGQPDAYGLRIFSESGALQFWGFFGGNFAQVDAPAPSANGVWTHVTVTYDAAATAPRLKLYLDGALVATNADAAGTMASSANPVWLGNVQDSWYELPGTLDEVRFYRTARTVSQIAQDMTTPVDPAAPFEVSHVTPSTGALGVRSTPVSATFSRAVNVATLTSSTFTLVDSAQAPVAATVAYDADARRATLTPSASLQPLSSYTARIVGGAGGVAAAAGGTLAADVTWTFTTVSAVTDSVASYAFSEASGVTVEDGSGNGNDGTMLGGQRTGAGKVGQGLAFDGVVAQPGEDESVLIPASDSLAFTDAFSIAAWVRPTSGAGIILSKPGSYDLRIHGETGSPLFYGLFDGVDGRVLAPSALPLNVWSHVVVTYDANAAAPRMKMYVDGALVESADVTGVLALSGTALRIGGAPYSAMEFPGTLDELHVYRRALSATDVEADRAAGLDDETPPTVTVTSPVAGATGVNPGTVITAVFSESLSSATVNTSSFVLRDGAGAVIPAVVTYDGAARTAILDPSARLTNLTTYTATAMGGGAGSITDAAGVALAADVTWSFTTANAEMIAPVVTAKVTPAANAAGWHNGPVTVTFSCSDASGIAACPDPLEVLADGENQVFSGTATDAFGNQASTSVTLDVDRTPGTVTVDTPVNGLATAADQVVLSGHVADALSGMATARCNGVVTPVVNDVVECTVMLRPGRNEFVISALDVADNSGSAGIQVTRTAAAAAIRVSPSVLVMEAGGSRSLAATDTYGVPQGGVTWESSDTSVVTVDELGLLEATGTGTATITASLGSLEAEVSVTVLAAGGLTAGTATWRVEPSPGFVTGDRLLHAMKIDQTTPDLFMIETQGNTTNLRALGSDGTDRWSQVAPGVPMFADVFGGAVAAIGTDETPDYDIDWIDFSDGVAGDPPAMRSIARFGGPTDAAPWRYDSAGWLQSGITQAPDGTIYAIERIKEQIGVSRVYHASILAIDGQTGKVIQRVPIPDSPLVFHSTPGCEAGTPDTVYLQTKVVGPVIGADGAAHVAVHWVDIDAMTECNPGNPQNSEMYRTLDNNVRVVKLESNEEPVWTTISSATFTYAGGDDICALPVSGYLDNHVPVPDSHGGVMVRWIAEECDYSLTFRITRVDALGATAEHVVAENETIELAGDDGTAFLKDLNGVRAVDVATWSTKWTVPSSQVPMMPLDGGGALLRDPVGGALTLVDASGNFESLSSLGVNAPHSAVHFGRWEGTTAIGASMVVGPELHQAGFAFQRSGGNELGAPAPTRPYETIEDAAIAAMQYFNPASIVLKREYGGSICKVWSRYRPSVPNVNFIFSDTVVSSGCQQGDRVARYHTHADVGNNGPSSFDMNNALNDGDGAVFRPHYVATPCGYMFRYSGPGPNGTIVRLSETTETSVPPCVP
jgi:uncharacterized protein YjdB